MSDDLLPLAIIGAGFSGTMTALHLLRASPRLPLLLCERSSVFARGAAYSTANPAHLLNVRASNMSAFSEEPNHFTDWLSKLVMTDETNRHIQDCAAGTFVSRELYGRYLTTLLREHIGNTEGALRLRLVADEAIDLLPAAHGYTLVLSGGRRHAVAGAVLAIGNLQSDEGSTDRYVRNPWDARATEALQPDRPVVILGSGLTMVDIAMQLWAGGFSGPVIAISRHGQLPRTHVMSAPWPPPVFTEGEATSVSRLMRRVRQEVGFAASQGVPWQSVVDGLRPITATIWQNLPEAEQRRFVRHARRWWDVHRHRTAPPIAQQLRSLITRGFLRIEAGRVTSIDNTAGHVRVTYRPRGEEGARQIEAQRVIDATGVVPASDVDSPLLQSLLRQGLVRFDRHRLGIEVTESLRVIAPEQTIAEGLWALGPIVRGVFWECTAVPDIRKQAAELAKTIAFSAEMTTGRKLEPV